MLSLIACYLMIPLCVLLFALIPKEHVLSRRLPKFRFNLRTIAALVAVFAIDFAMISLVIHPNYGFQLYAIDVAVLLVPLMVGTLTRQSAMTLWFVATLVGLLGTLSLPSITIH